MRAALLAIGLLAAQAPQRDAPSSPAAGTAAIRGRVVVAGTNAPVPRAIVTLTGAPGHPMPSRSVLANGDGGFEFTGLSAGAYGVSARPTPYQMQFLAGSRTEVNAADGQITSGIDVGLPRAGAIVGRVVDEIGQPMGGVMMSAARVGDRPGMGGMSATSDEYGRFRLFHLTTGAYYVVARPSQIAEPGVTDGLGFLETYLPGTASREDAARVQVREGAEVDAGDVRVLRGRTLRIRGMVTDSQGRMPPLNRTSISLVYHGGSEGRGIDPAGGFDFGRRVAGTYTVAAAIRPESGEGVVEYVALPLTLIDADADALLLATAPAAQVKGRVVMEDATAPPAATLAIDAREPANGGIFLGPGSAPVAADLTFTFNRLAGPRLLRITGTGSSNLYLKSVLRGTEDVTNVPTIFTADDAVRVVLTSHFSRIEGTITDDGVRPVVGRDVIVFGEDRRGWVRWSTTVNVTRTDPKGHYATTSPLPSGRYYVVAVRPDRSLPAGGEVEPAILETLIRDATTVTVTDNEVRTVDLRLSGGQF